MAMEIVSDFKPIIENIFDFKYRYFAYLTGRTGLGKSTNIAKSLLACGLLKPMRIVCARQTMSSIKDSVHAQLADIIRTYDLPYVIYNDTIRAANGTVFIFKGLQETGVHNIRSMTNVNCVWLEEAQSVSMNSWESLVPTIRAKDSFIVVSANPDEESDIVYQLFGPDAEPRDDTFSDYKDFRYNPFPLEPTILHDITLMKKNRPDDYERVYLGKLRSSVEEPVVKSWSVVENVGVGRKSDKIYWSLDFNYNPQCSVICHWNGDHDFYFSDEIVMQSCPTLDVAEAFVRLYRQKYNNQMVIINGDASGRNRSSQSEYSNYAIIQNVLMKNKIPHRFNVPKQNPSVSNRVANFDNHVKGIDGKRHILVDPSCVHLIHACKLLGFDKNGDPLEIAYRPGMKTIDYAKSHIYDAASYCVFTNDPVVFQYEKKPKSRLLTLKEQFERSMTPRPKIVEVQA